MKRAALVLAALLPAAAPAQVEDPAYACMNDGAHKGYCVLRVEEFQEITMALKRRCMDRDT